MPSNASRRATAVAIACVMLLFVLVAGAHAAPRGDRSRPHPTGGLHARGGRSTGTGRQRTRAGHKHPPRPTGDSGAPSRPGTLGAAPPTDPAPAPVPPLAPHSPGSIYWGAVVGSQFNGNTPPWDMSVLSDFSRADARGKGMSIVPFYSPFSNCPNGQCTPYPFPSGAMSDIRAYGALPMLSWGSSSLQDSATTTPSDSQFTLAAVANGNFDSYITRFANDAKAWGHPFFLRFDWEMNGNWFAWGGGANTNQPADFVAAWRHVWSIFHAVGATNATWVWCPNAGDQNGPGPDFSGFYPGDRYVDWTCFDGYNADWNNTGWKSWDQVAGPTYAALNALAPGKPVMVGEFGSVTNGGSRPDWLSQMLGELPATFPNIHAIIYYDQGSDALETDASPLAFANGINQAAYLDNHQGGIAGSGSIPAPGP